MKQSPSEDSRISDWLPRRTRWSRLLEKGSLALENLANRLIGNEQLNPIYHTGTISVLLLAIVALTGFYLFLFFQYGFDVSYLAVVNRIETPFLARTARAVHRYASGALVLTVLLHAWRMLFMERFRGQRWLAWLTGILMTFILWLAGITGYWLIWDERAVLINRHFIDFLQQVTPWAGDYVTILWAAEVRDRSWVIFLLMFVAHLALFLVTAYLTYLHIKRLKRPRWIPEWHWIAVATAVLLLIAALFPAGLLPEGSFNKLPGLVRLDPIFLYYLPLNETPWANWLWAFMWLATAVAAALPWWRRQHTPPKVEVLADRCTGCEKCVKDCPFGALTMVERQDDSKFNLLAVANEDLCVSCGICIGSCDEFQAITLGEVRPEAIWPYLEEQLRAGQARTGDQPLKYIVTCQRHAAQGAEPYLTAPPAGLAVAVLPCTGAIPPSLLPRLVEAGAAEVEVVGCPPYDCANREGNMWEALRLTHERVPRLRRRFDEAPITAAWLAPDQFAQAIPLTVLPAGADAAAKPDYLSQRGLSQLLSWRNLVTGFILLGVVLLAQIWFTGLEFTPFPAEQAQLEVGLRQPLPRYVDGVLGWSEPADVQVQLWWDGEMRETTTYALSELRAGDQAAFYFEMPIAPGDHELVLQLAGPGGAEYVLYQGEFAAAPGDIIRMQNHWLPKPLRLGARGEG
ncbi:MAG: 4Fe-4S binding protein [Anaerolineales bacterium]|nr:4Fe-4S binding protein [Anaerolineales bacterium]MCB8960730.1 4Fe-4S binding protein [Ardenticatenales bacterium]